MSNGLKYRNYKSSGGFTLLEMVIVLGIIAAITGLVVLNQSTIETEQRLREASGSIESLTKRGRNIAVRQQRAYQLIISEGVISIQPRFTSKAESDFTESDEHDIEVVREDFEDITASEETDAGVTYEIKRWQSDKWILIEGDMKVVVTLEPTGLVEPISIRCTLGKSWLMSELHPLTAGVRAEEMSIEDES